MLIAEAAQQAGVNVQTIRYYERRGLLSRPARRTSSYRQYSLDAIRVVRFIKRAQDLGFTLDEIAELLELRGESRRDRGRIRALAERKLHQVETQDRRAAVHGARPLPSRALLRGGHDARVPDYRCVGSP